MNAAMRDLATLYHLMVRPVRGGTHAQLANLNFTDAAGHRTELTPGLLGYVLPGAQMRWTLKPAAKVFASGGTLETMINGQTVQQNISLADSPR